MILEGDQYLLVSPLTARTIALLNYVQKDGSRAVLFAYDLHPRYPEPQQNVKVEGTRPPNAPIPCAKVKTSCRVRSRRLRQHFATTAATTSEDWHQVFTPYIGFLSHVVLFE